MVSPHREDWGGLQKMRLRNPLHPPISLLTPLADPSPESVRERQHDQDTCAPNHVVNELHGLILEATTS